MIADLATLHRQLPDDLTVRQLAMLAIVAGAPAIGPGAHTRDIAEAMGVAKPVVSRGIDRLQSNALVQRKRNPLNGRDCLIEITPAGRDLIDRIARRP